MKRTGAGASARGSGTSRRSRNSSLFSWQNARSSGLSTSTISFIRVSPTTRLKSPHAGGAKSHQVAKHEVVRVLRAGERLPVQKHLAGECLPVELAEHEETLRHVPYSVALKTSRNSSASTGVAPARRTLRPPATLA